jgi:PAS domain S-box-containing protein
MNMSGQDEQSSVAGAHERPWRSAWLSWALVTIVVASLLALLLLPVVVGRETVRLRREIADRVQPARTALTQIEFAQARQVAAVRAFALTTKQTFLERYAEAGRQEDAAFDRLAPLVAQLEPGADSDFNSLRQASDHWHAESAWIAEGRVPATPFLTDVPTREVLYEEMLQSANRLDVRFRSLESDLRARIQKLEELQTWVSVALVLLALGSVIIVFWLGRELERGRAEAERERREKTAMLESTGDGIYVLDLAGRCTFINPAGAALLGYTPAELVGGPMHEKVHYRHADGTPYPAAECSAHGAYRRGDSSTEEEILWRKDERPLPVEYAASPIWQGGEITGAVVVFRDITERRQIERERAALLESERLAREAAESAEQWSRYLARVGEVLSSSLDYDTTLRSVAQLAVPFLADWCVVHLVAEPGRRGGSAVEHPDAEKAALARTLIQHLPGVTPSLGGIARVLDTGSTQLLTDVDEAHRRRWTGNPERLAILNQIGVTSAVAVRLMARGEVVGAMAFLRAGADRPYSARDVARAEELARRASVAVENARLYEATEQALRTRDDVLAVVSHDLRNSLNTIVMAVDLLEDRVVEDGADDGDRIHKQLSIIRRSVDQAGRLIGDLLDVGRIERGRMTVSPEPCDVARLVRDAVELHQPAAAERGIRLERDVAESLSDVLADRERILQVFGNLIGNALKFTGEGGRVRVQAERNGDGIGFAVVDSGGGIAEQDLPHLFTPFWQGRNADRMGAGLGLAICRGIIEAHGGIITADSKLGAGTTIRFTLPAAPSENGIRTRIAFSAQGEHV